MLSQFPLSDDVLIRAIEQSNLAHTISRIDGDRELIYVNNAFLEQTGYDRDEVIGRNCRFLQGEGTDANAIYKIKEALAAYKNIDVEILNYKKDGTPFWNYLSVSPVFDHDQKPIAFVGIQSDVSDVKKAERVDQERQKLEALGRMTGNISHEIKNTLQPVKLMGEMLQDWESLSKENVQKCVDLLNENMKLVDHVVQDVLSFSRKPEIEPKPYAVQELQDDVVRFVKGLLHSRVKLVINVQNNAAAAQFVEVNQNALHQVLINLVSNALHAMQDKGTLTLHSNITEMDAGHVKKTYLCIAIEDTGCGMDEKTKRSAFDPFFSTKPPGEGTGFGLSISYKIINELGGNLKVESEEGKGSTFTISLPITS